MGQGTVQQAPQLGGPGSPLGFQVQVGHLAQGVDPRVRAPSAAEGDGTKTSLQEDMLDAARHGADSFPGLLGALFLPALELAAVVFNQQPEGGQGRGFLSRVRRALGQVQGALSHAQFPTTALTASMRTEGSWMGLAR